MHPAGGLYYQGDSVALPPLRTMSGSFEGTQGSNLQHFLPTHSLAQRSQFSAPESAGTTSSSYSLPQTNLISDKHKVLIFYFLYAVYSLFQREQQHLYPPLNLAGPTFRLRVELSPSNNTVHFKHDLTKLAERTATLLKNIFVWKQKMQCSSTYYHSDFRL